MLGNINLDSSMGHGIQPENSGEKISTEGHFMVKQPIQNQSGLNKSVLELYLGDGDVYAGEVGLVEKGFGHFGSSRWICVDC